MGLEQVTLKVKLEEDDDADDVYSMHLQISYPQDKLKTEGFKSSDGLKTPSKNFKDLNIHNLTILPNQNIFFFLYPPSSSAEVEERVHLHLYSPSVPSGRLDSEIYLHDSPNRQRLFP
jgi:hypothetical protein